MRFLCVTKPAKAQIYGHEYSLRPLDPRIENIQDILVTDLTSASELLQRHPDVLVEVNVDTRKCQDFPIMIDRASDVKPGGKVLIINTGGIGDHIMLLPALRVYRDLFPSDTKIWFAAQTDMHAIFFSNPCIDKLLPLPLTLDWLMKAHSVIDFSSRHDWYDLKSMNMTDGYLHFLKIEYEGVREKSPQLMWSSKNSPRIYKIFRQIRDRNPGKPLVLLNWKASNRLRSMPPENFLFLSRKYDDFLFVVAQSKGFSAENSSLLKEFGKNVFDCSSFMSTLSDYIGAVANCDAVVSTDTGTVHLAEALGRPCIALYGPTIDDIWIRYYRHVTPLRADYTGQSCCAPCGMTKNTDKGCPEAVASGIPYSPCLLSISEEKIESAFVEMMEERRIQDTGFCIQDAGA